MSYKDKGLKKIDSKSKKEYQKPQLKKYKAMKKIFAFASPIGITEI